LRTFIPKNSTISWRCWGSDVSASTCVCGIDLHSPMSYLGNLGVYLGTVVLCCSPGFNGMLGFAESRG
jgi:hypothetical protein